MEVQVRLLGLDDRLLHAVEDWVRERDVARLAHRRVGLQPRAVEEVAQLLLAVERWLAA